MSSLRPNFFLQCGGIQPQVSGVQNSHLMIDLPQFQPIHRAYVSTEILGNLRNVTPWICKCWRPLPPLLLFTCSLDHIELVEFIFDKFFAQILNIFVCGSKFCFLIHRRYLKVKVFLQIHQLIIPLYVGVLIETSHMLFNPINECLVIFWTARTLQTPTKIIPVSIQS